MIFTLYRFFIFLLLSSLILPAVATAQDLQDLDFVYATNHYNGATFSSALVPGSVDTFYLLADQTSMVAARMTRVYYWQITNQYRADWDAANVIVEGTLEVLKGIKLVQSSGLSDYVIQYDANDKIDSSMLYLGADARAARENYEALQAEYRADLSDYYKVLNEYTALYQAALAKLQKGLISEDQLPETPAALADFSLFSTDVLSGFPLNLPAGEYTVRLKLTDGSIMAGSSKRLVVFDALGEGIGYRIAGADRWNLPEDSLSNSEVVYGLKDGTYYLEPLIQKQYNELFYTRMNNPQDTTARKERTLWVPFRSAQDVTLSVYGQHGQVDLELEDFFVQQILGTKLGYNIIPFDAEKMTQPTFTKFELTLDDSLVFRLALKDAQGRVLEGSTREIRVINTNRTLLLYLVSCLPLLIGLVIVLVRRRKVRNIKVIGVG